MISQSESGLTASQYNALVASELQHAYRIIAHRWNLDFSEQSTDTTVSSNTDIDFCVVKGSDRIWRLSGTTLEWMNPSTMDWTSATALPALPATRVNTPGALQVDGTTIRVWLCLNDGLYMVESTNNGSSWGSWTKIYGSTGSTLSYGSDLTNGLSASALSSTQDGSHSDDFAFSGTDAFWQTSSGGGSTGWIGIDLGSAKRVSAYRIKGRTGGSNLDQGPKTWTLQSSTANTFTSPVTHHTVTDAPSWKSGEERTYYPYPISGGLPSYTAHRYWRINVTANHRDTRLAINEIELFEMVSTSTPQVIRVAAADENRIHLVWYDHTYGLYQLRSLTKNGSSWDAATSDIYWTAPINSFSAAEVGSTDVIVIEAEVPGFVTIVNKDNQEIKKIQAAGGVMAFIYQGGYWSSHIEVDVLDRLETWLYRQNVSVININGKLVATAYASDGTESNPITSVRMYTSKEGRFWSGPQFVPIADGVGPYGLRLVDFGDYLYAFERQKVYRSDMTLMFGTSPSALQVDLTDRVEAYDVSYGQGAQIGILVNNDDEFFDDHAFLDGSKTVALTLDEGFWCHNNSGTYSAYDPENTDPLEKVLVRTGVFEVDSIDRTADLPDKMVRLVARDRSAWISGKSLSEESQFWKSHLSVLDTFADDTDSKYGGLAHTAIQTGEWTTKSRWLRVESEDTPIIAFSTFESNLWNGTAQCGFRLNSSDTNGQTFGLLFRALDANSFWMIFYLQQADDLQVYEFRDGVGTLRATLNAAIGWDDETLLITRYIRVEYYYGQIKVFTSSDSSSSADDGGRTWTLQGTTYMNCLERPVGAPYLRPVSSGIPLSRGYVGARGKSEAEAGTSVRIKNLMISDDRPALVLEDVYRLYGAYGGIHDFSFDEYFSPTTSDWSQSTVTVSGDDLIFTPPGSPAAYYHTYHTGKLMPTSYLVRFSSTQTEWGVVVAHNASTGEFYFFTVSSTRVLAMYFWNGSTTDTLLTSTDITVPAGSVEVGFRQVRFGDQNSPVFHVMSLWVNGRVIASTVREASAWSSIYFGVSAMGGGGSKTFTGLHIPELTPFADWVSIDPSEAPLSGLNRAIEGYYTKHFARYNGAIRAWKPKATSSVLTYALEDLNSYAQSFVLSGLRTHIRQVGAYVEADYRRIDLIKKYGHRFGMEHNPYLITEGECYEQAQRSIQRDEEQITQESFSTEAHPLLEIEDHVTTPAGERIVTSRSVRMEAGKLMESLQLRSYIYGS